MEFQPTTSAVTGRRSNQLSHRALQDVLLKTTQVLSMGPKRLVLTLAIRNWNEVQDKKSNVLLRLKRVSWDP